MHTHTHQKKVECNVLIVIINSAKYSPQEHGSSMVVPLYRYVPLFIQIDSNLHQMLYCYLFSSYYYYYLFFSWSCLSAYQSHESECDKARYFMSCRQSENIAFKWNITHVLY